MQNAELHCKRTSYCTDLQCKTLNYTVKGLFTALIYNAKRTVAFKLIYNVKH